MSASIHEFPTQPVPDALNSLVECSERVGRMQGLMAAHSLAGAELSRLSADPSPDMEAIRAVRAVSSGIHRAIMAEAGQ